MTVKTALSDLLRTKTGDHEHQKNLNWALGHSWYWNMAVQPPRQWKQHYLIFPALNQEFISIAQPLHFSKLTFRTFLVPKHDHTTSTGPPWKWKRLHLIFQALKPESTSIVQPLQLWKLYLCTFLVLKDACATFTTEKTTSSDLLCTETGVP